MVQRIGGKLPLHQKPKRPGQSPAKLARARGEQTTTTSVVVAREAAMAPLVRPTPQIPGPENLLDYFLRRSNPNTRDAYHRDLESFASYLGCSPQQAVDTLFRALPGPANGMALGWLQAMEERGEQSATRARRLSALRALSRLARTLGVVPWELSIQGPKVEKYRNTRGPALDAIRAMIEKCPADLEGMRDRVIIRLLYSLALRRAEVCALRISDYDVQGKRLRVVGKGGTEVWKTLPNQLKDVLDAWLMERAYLGAPQPNDPLVCTLRRPGAGKPLTRRGMNFTVERIGERSGIDAWPHAFRHASVTQALGRRHKFDARDVQKHSRHKNLQTVIIYDDNVQDVAGEIAEALDAEL